MTPPIMMLGLLAHQQAASTGVPREFVDRLIGEFSAVYASEHIDSPFAQHVMDAAVDVFYKIAEAKP